MLLPCFSCRLAGSSRTIVSMGSIKKLELVVDEQRKESLHMQCTTSQSCQPKPFSCPELLVVYIDSVPVQCQSLCLPRQIKKRSFQTKVTFFSECRVSLVLLLSLLYVVLLGNVRTGIKKSWLAMLLQRIWH